jgi:hypothetical protein
MGISGGIFSYNERVAKTSIHKDKKDWHIIKDWRIAPIFGALRRGRDRPVDLTRNRLFTPAVLY